MKSRRNHRGVTCLVLAVALGTGTGLADTVAWWRFEPGSLTTDSSGNGNTLSTSGAIVTNDVPLNAVGNTAGSAYFNGSAFAKTIGTLNLSGFTNVTVEWFMKPKKATGTAIVWEQSANAGGLTGAMGAFMNNLANGKLDLLQKLNTRVLWNSFTPIDGTDGKWHHYAVSLDTTQSYTNANAMKVYVDGAHLGGSYFGSGGEGVPASLVNQVLNIGMRDGAQYPFVGFIDELRVSSRLLSPTEFLLKPCSAHWKFEPGALTADSSGWGNSLTNVGVIATNDVPSRVRGGSAGSAYFNGSAFAKTINTLNVGAFTNITVEWYMKPKQATATAIVWEQSDDPGAVAGALASYINNNGAGTVTAMQDIGPRVLWTYPAVPDGTANGAWHHYAMTVDTTQTHTNLTALKLYVDGVDQGGQVYNVATTGGVVTLVNQVFNIGMRNGTEYPFAGFIDEIRVTGALLSPDLFLNAPPQGTVVLLR
ncbi:MAG: hypothetical protein PHR35_11680 [Kiritimatiellae bacterium]|nr:hypothetical protein [Kiritimatiellia bacterium]